MYLTTAGTAVITDQLDLIKLIELNLIAAKRAKSSTAYEPAVRYLTLALGILPKNSWQSDYELTLAIYIEAAETEYLNINFTRATMLAELAMQNTVTLLDRVKVYLLQMQICIAQLEMLKAIDIGLQVLETLSIYLTPINENNLLVELPDLSDIENIPVMTDPDKLSAMQILKLLCAPVFQAKPEIFPQVILTMIGLCTEYGHSALSAFAYGLYGLLLVGFGKLDAGYQAGIVALKLLEKFDAKELKAKVYNLFNSNIRTWKEAAKNSVVPLQEGVQSGLESGDIEWGGYCAGNLCSYLFFTGDNLESTVQEQAIYIDLCITTKQEIPIYFSQVWRQLALNLQIGGEEPILLVGESFDESKMLPRLIEAKAGTLLFVFYVAKTIICYHFKEYDLALKNVALANEQAGAAFGFMQVAILNFYHSLTLLFLYPNVSFSTQQEYLKQVEVNQENMKFWAYHAPMNNQHRYNLVEAEKARILGENWQAAELYDRAIFFAKENEFINEEALANELAAKFYLVRNKIKFAQLYMQEARYCYLRWGATAKVKDLDARYSQLLQKKSENAATETSDKTSNFLTTTGDSSSSALDLATVMKASQSIASEIVLDKLLASLMKISIENAGATNGFLILPKDGKLLIETSSSIDSKEIEVWQSMPVDESQDLPITVINYVERTRSDVVLSDAAREGAFTTDSYIVSNKLKSVLCTPIINQGKLIAILYLENKLTEGAFTADRVEVLRLLSSQAAISLENALLYANLEQKVQERTRELKAKEASLAEAQKLAHLGSWELDFQTQEAFWSDEMFRIHGFDPKQEKPSSSEYFQLIHPNDQSSVEKRLEGIINRAESYEIEYRILGTDGRERYIFAKTQATLNESGEVIKIFGTVLDITEPKLAEIAVQESEAQLRQTLEELKRTQSQLIQTEKMSSLGQMVAGVAHEINNPVSFIYGNITPALQYVEDLLRLIRLYQESYPHPTDEIVDTTEEIDLEFLVEDLQKLMGSMKNGADRIRTIVLSLRNFSRLDESDMKAVDIHEGIDSTLLIVQHRLKQSDANLEIDVIKEYAKLPLVTCYASQMNQVFMNILNNAIDALQQSLANHRRLIRIRTEVTDSDSVRILIADNGSGMSEDVLSKIFDPFFTTKPVGSGTGLGLSICYQIVVEKHGGQLSCISAPGEGTEFAIVLPQRLRDRASD